MTRASSWVTVLAVVAVLGSACGGAPVGTAPTATAAAGTPAPTATAAPYKSGDKFTILVPYNAGGGYDVYARTLQPYLQAAFKEVTGSDVSVVVQNQPAAAGQRAVEETFTAQPDGKQVVLAGLDIITSQQVLGGASFDARKMTPVAQITDQVRGLIIRPGVLAPGAPFTFQSLLARSQQKPILWGSGGLGVAQKLLFKTLKDAGNELKVDTVEFQGSAEAVPSLLRNEVEVQFQTLAAAMKTVQSNPSLKVLVSFGARRDSYAADVPTLTEQGIRGADKIAKTSGTSVRAFLAPPDVSAATATTVQAVFDKAINNKDFVSASEKLGNAVTYGKADAVSQIIGEWIAMYEANKDLLK